MDLEREPQPQTHGGAADSEDATLSDDEWPVDEHYFVEPVPAPVQAELESIRREEPGPSRDPRGRSRVPLALLLVLLALLGLLALSVAWIVGRDDPSQATPLGRMPSSSAGTTGQTPTSTTSPATPASAVSVPQVNGLQLADARARLEKAGFRVRVRSRTSDAPQDQVLGQSPGASSKAASKSFVVLTVGKGSKRVVVPSLVGLTADAASRKIRGLGLRSELRLVRSSEPVGTVLDQAPASSAQVATKSVVRLDVAKHVQTVVRVEVPGVVGLQATTARRKLAGAGLEVSVAQVPSGRPEHSVVSQSPSAGAEVRKGTSVTIRVSTGPAQVTVPSVVGLDEQSARDQLEAAGFVVRVVDESTTDPSQDGMVTAQEPSGGTDAPKGSTVVLTVARLS